MWCTRGWLCGVLGVVCVVYWGLFGGVLGAVCVVY